MSKSARDTLSILAYGAPTLAAALLYLAMIIPCRGESLADCFTAAGQRYGIAPRLLQAIGQVESGLESRARHVNTDGSVDVGVMQINSAWFPLLQRYGIAPAMLWHPCYNVHVGAWILSEDIRQYGYTWEAVGAYHAGTRQDLDTERRREAYAHRIHRHLACAADRLRCPAYR